MFIQASVHGEFNPKELVANSVEDVAAMVEEEKALLKIMRKHRNLEPMPAWVKTSFQIKTILYPNWIRA